MLRRLFDAAALLLIASNAMHLGIALIRYLNALPGRFNDPFKELA